MIRIIASKSLFVYTFYRYFFNSWFIINWTAALHGTLKRKCLAHRPDTLRGAGRCAKRLSLFPIGWQLFIADFSLPRSQWIYPSVCSTTLGAFPGMQQHQKGIFCSYLLFVEEPKYCLHSLRIRDSIYCKRRRNKRYDSTSLLTVT